MLTRGDVMKRAEHVEATGTAGNVEEGEMWQRILAHNRAAREALGDPLTADEEKDVATVTQKLVQRVAQVPIVTPRGKFMWINKHKLEIDHANYQRVNVVHSKVVTLAKNWSWIAAAAIVVANRHGHFFIIDGQYRTLAAKLRPEIDTMPCMVWDIEDVRAEAEAFLAINTNRRFLEAANRFRGELAAGDENAMFVAKLLAGRSLDKAHPDSVQCITAIKRAAAVHRPELVRVWPIIEHLCKGRAIGVVLVHALVWIECHMPPGQSLTDRKWLERLIDIGHDELVKAAQEARAYHGKFGGRVYGGGIVKRLNWRLRQPLQLVSTDDDK